MPLSWEAFLIRYGPMAHALARPHVRPPASAEDVVQEAALALHHALEREPERFASPDQARNYFLRTVRNLALRARRDARPLEPLRAEPPAPENSDPDARTLRARQRALARVLAELEPESRDLIRRRFLEHHTLAHIARESGIAISTLHDREKALLRDLRLRLARLDQEALG